MPAAATELSTLLAGDKALCIRRRPAPRGPTAEPKAARANDASPALAGFTLSMERGHRVPSAGEDPSATAESVAPPPADSPLDPQLLEVIDAWPLLPATVQTAILAIIAATGGGRS
jgi:hypothetical protein